MEKWPAVYILASKFRGTIYIGVTSDLEARIWEHRAGIKSKFPAKYAVHRLVYVETLGDMESAISREKQLKRWHRQWKINLIEADNPRWTDLAVGPGFAPLQAQAPAPSQAVTLNLFQGPTWLRH